MQWKQETGAGKGSLGNKWNDPFAVMGGKGGTYENVIFLHEVGGGGGKEKVWHPLLNHFKQLFALLRGINTRLILLYENVIFLSGWGGGEERKRLALSPEPLQTAFCAIARN